MSDLRDLTIAEAARLIERRQLSPVELTEAYLEAIERLNPQLNAYVLPTVERARADAAAAADEIARGEYRGPLHGIPIGLKDLFDTEGIETAGGAAVLRGRVPERDSTPARRLREAGTVLLGKTNTHEFAWGTTTNNPHTGATHNPWDTTRIPGGSSGGSGAAIAARLAAGTLGTDTGGSIRIPAALNGCVGLKPTFGRVSKYGVLPMSWQFDHPGPIARTVEDAAILLQAIAGYDPADFATVPMPVPDYRATLGGGVKGLRIGVPREQFFALLDGEVNIAVEEALEVFRSLGAEVIDVDPGFTRVQTSIAWQVVNAEGQLHHRPTFSVHPELYSEELAGVLKIPLPDSIGLTEAYRASYDVKEAVRTVLETVDVLVTPSSLRVASVIGDERPVVEGVELSTGAAFASLTMPFNIAGVPAMSIPCGFNSEGLPIGLQIAGRPFDESTVLRVGHAYESATEWHRRRPPVS